MVNSYVYKIENKITGQYYIGSRFRNVKEKTDPKDDLWVKYFSSSKYVDELLSLYGKESFNAIVIFEYGDYDICYWYEQLLIRESINDDLCINKSYFDPDTTKKKFSTAGVPKVITQDCREKMSLASLGKSKTATHAANISRGLTGKVRATSHSKNISTAKKGKPNKNKGKSTSLKGKTWEEIYGIEGASERRKNMRPRPAKIVSCPHCMKTGSAQIMQRWHFSKCKFL